MLFNSINFLVFFPLVTIAYFCIPHKFRWSLLLVSSCVFYMFFIPKYILILAITILIDYWAGIFIEKNEGRTRKIYLIISIVSTCLVLFIFKYFNFFNTNLKMLADFLHWNYPIETLNIILPIGLSFHTFQSLSYVIEVYRRNQKAEKHFGIYSLYVMFYPQLVAGPIERPQNLLHQFYEEHSFDYKRVTNGLKLMLWGLFKKVVIADRLAVIVNNVYDSPYDHTGLSLVIATVFFAFQIYCDFSGYSDIAIGSAQVMGFKLMDNFNRPYFSKSVAEFWKRWHISLSSWFRDYLYISLGGNRVGRLRRSVNLMITFIVSGLWHGANWTYVVWGALNGLYIVIGLSMGKFMSPIYTFFGLNKRPVILKYFKVFFTFFLICISWIFFRSKSLKEACYIISSIFTSLNNMATVSISSLKLGVDSTQLITALAVIVFMEIVHLIQRHGSIREMLSDKPVWLRWAFYYVLIFGIIFLAPDNHEQFIYFQF